MPRKAGKVCQMKKQEMQIGVRNMQLNRLNKRKKGKLQQTLSSDEMRISDLKYRQILNVEHENTLHNIQQLQ